MSVTLGALIGATALSGALSAGGGIAGNIIQGEYNKAEAQRNRDFQERMSNTAIQRSVADARAAGISPSLVLGGASQPMGNSASIGQPDIGGIMASTANKIIDTMREDRKLDAMEKMQSEILQNKQNMQNERLEHQTQMQQMKMSNSANNFTKHNYKKEELDGLFDDIKKIQL